MSLYQVSVNREVRRSARWAKTHQFSVELVAPVSVHIPQDTCVAKENGATAFLRGAAVATTSRGAQRQHELLFSLERFFDELGRPSASQQQPC